MATCTLTKNGNVIFVASELLNITLHPAERSYDVECAKVGYSAGTGI